MLYIYCAVLYISAKFLQTYFAVLGGERGHSYFFMLSVARSVWRSARRRPTLRWVWPSWERSRSRSSRQCSGSTGSTCFLASRIRILLSSCKNNKKNLESHYFVTLFDFLSLKNNVNVPSKCTVNSRKNCVKN